MFNDERLLALIIKEFRQVLRDKQLISLLIVPPLVQIIIYGFALDPNVRHLRLGVIDLAKSPISRELISALVENQTFELRAAGNSIKDLARKVQDGKLEAGLVIPAEFERDIKHGTGVIIQIFLDGVDANTAGIASGYLSQMLGAFDQTLPPRDHDPPSPIVTDVDFVYNPGLVSSWFFVPGVMGLALTLAGTMVASSVVIREKESGTLEQLLMAPVSAYQILVAKIVPLIVLLFVNVIFGLALGMIIFHVPFRGSPFTLLFISSIYMFVTIAFGIALATVSGNQRQAMLTSFFINLPLIQFSGATAPLESMPPFARQLALLDPLRYYIVCLRGVLLKGVGLEVLWPDVVALTIIAVALLSLSSYRFRRQLE
jgi:ABC-2 type transport system permease protein